jgi:hypothetical protein
MESDGEKRLHMAYNPAFSDLSALDQKIQNNHRHSFALSFCAADSKDCFTLRRNFVFARFTDFSVRGYSPYWIKPLFAFYQGMTANPIS